MILVFPSDVYDIMLFTFLIILNRTNNIKLMEHLSRNDRKQKFYPNIKHYLAQIYSASFIERGLDDIFKERMILKTICYMYRLHTI